MNARDRYNHLINSIEEQAKKKYKNADNIVLSMQKSFCYDVRDLNAIFRFMTGETILEYVKKRKLMASYEVLIRQHTFKIEDAIVVSGYDNQNSFTKKFSSEFGMPPKEAQKKKDRSLYIPAKTWEEISCNSNRHDGIEERLPMKQKTKFGISQSNYQQAMKIIELESIYKFNKMYTELANTLYEELEIPVEDVFGFVESIRMFCGEYACDLEALAKSNERAIEEYCAFKNYLSGIAHDPYICFLYFERHFSVGLAFELNYRIRLTKAEIMKLDRHLLETYIQNMDVEFFYFQKAYNYFMIKCNGKYNDEMLEGFINYVASNTPIEEAYEMAYIFLSEIEVDMFEPIISKQEERELLFADFDFIERMAKEEEAWHNEDISDRYDEENEAYYEEDYEDSNDDDLYEISRYV